MDSEKNRDNAQNVRVLIGIERENNMPICSKCKKNKDITNFYQRNDKRYKNKLRRDCKDCLKKRTKKNYFENWEKRKLAHKNDYHNRRRYLLLYKKYNITKKEFEEMSIKQKGRCAICSGKMKWYLHIDHNHKTGKIRGLLCQTCNAGLGCFKDNLKLLNLAIKYLMKYE